MGTEDWVLKGTKLITNAKKQRLKIQGRGWIFKNTILKKRRRRRKKEKKVTRIIKNQQQPQKNIYMAFALKIGSFFEKQQQVIKTKIKGEIEDLKIKKKC